MVIIMRIRLGYACISETLPVTSSSTYTYTNFSKEKDYQKLDKIIQSNFLALEKILQYNIKNNIHFYRLSSNIIPLATKKEVIFDYVKKYQEWYKKIGAMIKKHSIRVDFHPNEYCILNSTKKEVVENSIKILEYHYQLLLNFNIEPKILVLHIGSSTFGKENSIKRFCNNFKKLPIEIQKCIAIENDDKIFTVDDCLKVYELIKTPIVFDYHHNYCNSGNTPLEESIKKVLLSWNNITPKIHFSSPKSKLKKEFRSHHDYIESEVFINFLEEIKKYNQNIDIMIEAKRKDEALFRLIRELKYKCNYKFIDETTFIV